MMGLMMLMFAFIIVALLGVFFLVVVALRDNRSGFEKPKREVKLKRDPASHLVLGEDGELIEIVDEPKRKVEYK